MIDCFTCRHSHATQMPDGRIDFNNRQCRESPPTPVIVAMTPTGPAVQALFPVVGRGCVCDRYDPRLVGDQAPSVETTQ